MTFLHVLIKTSCFKETTTEPVTKRQICCRGSINFSMTTQRSSINIIVCKNELDHINLFDITTSPYIVRISTGSYRFFSQVLQVLLALC